MPDPKQETSPETQEVETSSPDASSEATTKPVETSAQPDSTEQKVETESRSTEKTPEQKAESTAYFQAEAQRAKEELKAIQETQTPTPEVSEAPASRPQVQPGSSQPIPQTREELDEYVRDHPLDSFEAYGSVIRQEIRAELAEHRQMVTLEGQSREANRVVKEFCARNKVSAETLKEAQGWISESGLKGSPASLSGAMIDRIQYLELIGNNDKIVLTKAAEAATAAQTQALTTQPETVGPETKGPQTYEKQLAAKFGPTKADSFTDEFN